ncbi:MAG: sialate O-acetylesterase, partial [Muribaculaceae bacterium]|nr:sialate O-acetylesterase [Muribaculaceae bacterium]
MNLRFLFLALILGITLSTSAHIVLPSLIGDNMVLQQQTDARLWGKCAPQSTISIVPSWSGETIIAHSDRAGNWNASLPTPKASTKPYSITFTDKDGSKTIFNVLIGEVWYCSGQSNMEMPVRGYKHQPVDGGLDVILSARETTPIRMFTVGKTVSSTPLDSCAGHWGKHIPDEVADCSAT